MWVCLVCACVCVYVGVFSDLHVCTPEHVHQAYVGCFD
jgi:hypothetical protein